MGTGTIQAACKIAIPTENLISMGVSCPFQETIHAIAAPGFVAFPIVCTISSDMVNGQEFDYLLTATTALPTVMLNHLLLYLFSVISLPGQAGLTM